MLRTADEPRAAPDEAVVARLSAHAALAPIVGLRRSTPGGRAGGFEMF
ncbi:MAG TPA: hypothetical protein VFG47_02845 [Geminicoccaceae bacterium]|nr:hypothetical protein [Geminicoccaceae bacterium]